MRFLQTEWHRHERERNQWEIERAEMRARIARLEGENNSSKRLQQGYLKRVKMLELMLKQERYFQSALSPKQLKSLTDSSLQGQIGTIESQREASRRETRGGAQA